MRLGIPAKTPDQIGPTIYKLIQLSQIVNKSQAEVITLDFTNTKFLHSIFISCLYSFIEIWRKDRTIIIENINEGIKPYFDAVHFPNGYILDGTNDAIDNISAYNSKRFTPLVIFPTYGVSREECVNTVLDVIHKQTCITGVFRTAVDYLVSELTNNISDHSGKNYGILFAQTYTSKGFIDISICDTGIGILNSYAKSDKFYPKDEAEAIQMAITGRSAKDRAESRGFGLSTSRNMIADGMNGTFLLWSGQTLFVQNQNVKNVLNVDDGSIFQGCFLTIRLPLNPKSDFDFYKYIDD